MSVDPNEVAAFVSHCVNIAWLETLRRHVEARIARLGGVPKYLLDDATNRVLTAERPGKHAADLVPVYLLPEDESCPDDADADRPATSSARTNGPEYDLH